MAVYKPTDCSPFNGTFDLNQDKPIFLECRVDTSNTVVNGYSINVYDENGKMVFPKDGGAGKLNTHVTYLPNMKKYVEEKYSERIVGYKNANSGINGTYIVVPFIGDLAPDTNQDSDNLNRNMTDNTGSEFFENNTYYWEISLYQNVTYTDDKEITFPTEERYYDMMMASGQVLGSNDKRLQCAQFRSDTIVLDRYIQPVKITSLSASYTPDKPTEWLHSGEITIEGVGSRALATAYDREFGILTPSTAVDSSFSVPIQPEQCNAIALYRNGNIKNNLSAGDIVSYVYNGPIVSSDSIGFQNMNPRGAKWTWMGLLADPGNSYWEETYYATTSAQDYTPLDSATVIREGERVLFNRMYKGSVWLGGEYLGSPYNGIFYPKYSSQPEGEKTKVTVEWFRATDANSWGAVSNKVVTVTGSSLDRDLKSTNYLGLEQEGSSYKVEQFGETYGSDLPATGRSFRVYYEDSYGNYHDDSATYSNDKLTFTPTASISASYGCYVIFASKSMAENGLRKGDNAEISARTNYGQINKTPILFTKESPIQLYDSSEFLEDQNPLTVAKESGGKAVVVQMENVVGTVSNVSVNNAPISNFYTDKFGSKNIYFEYDGTIADTSKVKITYKKSSVEDYYAILFYNNIVERNSLGVLRKKGHLYIRPYSEINENMILLFKEQTGNRWIDIDKVNKDYWFVEYSNVNPSGAEDGFAIDSRYQVKSFYRRSNQNPISFYSKPTAEIQVYDRDKSGESMTGDVYTPKTRDIIIYAKYKYADSNYIPWKSYRIIVYNSNDNWEKLDVYYDTGDIYDGDISAEVHGLDGYTDEKSSHYVAEIIIETTAGYVISNEIKIEPDVTEDFIPPQNYASCSINKLDNSVSIVLNGINDMEDDIEYYASVYRRDVWIDKYDLDEDGKPTSRHNNWKQIISGVEIKENVPKEIIDLTVLNGHNYEYSVCYYQIIKSSKEQFEYCVIRLPISVNFDCWYLTELHEIEPNKYSANLSDTWRFKYNVSAGDQVQNIIKNQQDTLSKFPRFSHGEKNNVNGTVSCLLGREIIPANYENTEYTYKYVSATETMPDVPSWVSERVPCYNDGGYIESLGFGRLFDNYKSASSLGFRNLTSNRSVDVLNAWRDVCYSGNPKLLRDSKGQGFVIQIVNVSSKIEENMDRRPTTISFDWVQIGDVKDITVSEIRPYDKTQGGGEEPVGVVIDYSDLTNLPRINGKELKGNVTSEDINVESNETQTFVNGMKIRSGFVYNASGGSGAMQISVDDSFNDSSSAEIAVKNNGYTSINGVQTVLGTLESGKNYSISIGRIGGSLVAIITKIQ